jgi:palmitoyltransferase
MKNGDNPTPSSAKFHLLFLFFVSIMFAISVSSLFFYHLYLTGKNRTTLGKDIVFGLLI